MGTPSNVEDETRWASALKHEQSAPWLPCTKTVHNRPGYNDTLTTGVLFDTASVDFVCLAQNFASGTLTDPMTWPTAEKEYDDWYKDHLAAAHFSAATPLPQLPPITAH